MIGDADAGDDGYVTIGELLDDEIVKNPKCPLCHSLMTSKSKPLHSKGQRYTFHYSCKRDGDMLLVLKLHRNFHDTWRAKRTVSRATDEQLAEFKRGLERTAIRKKARRRKPNGPRRVQSSAKPESNA